MTRQVCPRLRRISGLDALDVPGDMVSDREWINQKPVALWVREPPSYLRG